jgi:creatine kinase
MGSGVSTTDMSADQMLAAATAICETNPGNRCTKYIKELGCDYYNGLKPEQQAVFQRCVRTGLDNKDSGLGCYAMSPDDYTTFAGFFDKVIQDYHSGTAESKHVTDWDISKMGKNGDGVLDVTELGLETLSMRVRVGRNLKGFNLPGLMDKAERIKFEQAILPAFEKLKETYGGTVNSMSPDWGEGVKNPNLISAERYQELVDAHVMFKDMDADSFLKSAGIASDWPYGRGCWQSDSGEAIVWFGEEDQLRIMCMKKGTKLNEVFNDLKALLDTFENIDGVEFATSEKYGYVTSCPSNLGTGMRASVHIKVPNLTSDGSDAKAKAICKPLGLSVRGTGGEHTPIGADGTIDLSPSARLFIKESEIVSKLYQGISDLMVQEKAAAPAATE